MGNYCYRLGQYDSCRYFWQRSIDIRKLTQGPVSTEIASLLQNVATLQGALGNPFGAIEGLEEVLQIRDSLGEMHTENTANTLNNLSQFYTDVGRFDDAVQANEKARQLYIEVLGPDHPRVGLSLGNAAQDLIREGKDARAEQYLLRAIAIMTPTLGDDHFEMTNIYNAMAVILKKRGRTKEAKEYLLKTIAIIKEKLAESHIQLLTPMYNLADILNDEGDYDAADSIAREAQMVAAEFAGVDSHVYLTALHNRAFSLSKAGRYDIADSLWGEVLSRWSDSAYTISRDMVVVQDAIATSYRQRGDINRAESLMVGIVDRTREVFGETHPKTAQAERHLARIWFDLRKYAGAAKMSLLAFRTSLNLVRDNAPFVTERDALRLSNNLRYDRNLYLSSVMALPDTTQVMSDVAEVVLASKGQISDAIFQRKRKSTETSDPRIRALKRRLQGARFALSNAFFDEEPTAVADSREHFDKLTTTVDSLEHEMILAMGVTDKPEEAITVADVLGAIPERSALVEYLRFKRFSPDVDEPEPFYLALTMTSDMQVMVSWLGDAKEVDDLVAAYRTHMKRVASKTGLADDADMTEYRRIAGRLTEHVWSMVVAEVSAAANVYLSPDGSLNLVSFGSLPVSKKQYMMETHRLYYLGAGRDILTDNRAGRTSNDNLLALGAPAFDVAGDPVDDSISVPSASSPLVVDIPRGGETDCLMHGLDSVRALPLSRIEVETVAAEWAGNHPDAGVILLMDSDASEARFKEKAPACGVIHLATHGFYFSALCHEGQYEAISPPHPLLSSGLFLAGANVRGNENTETGEDGILTAFELAEMDLSQTHLAVLSACETGLGKVSDGEGVYGLRRAFQMAGVESVVCSLWPVSDRLTAQFMTRLYASDAGSPADAIQQQQLAELHRLRDAGLSDHPARWAAFIDCERGR
jgi:CHAT domain-containing protein/tetratricopeptide (TPR) repeat protein